MIAFLYGNRVTRFLLPVIIPCVKNGKFYHLKARLSSPDMSVTAINSSFGDVALCVTRGIPLNIDGIVHYYETEKECV